MLQQQFLGTRHTPKHSCCTANHPLRRRAASIFTATHLSYHIHSAQPRRLRKPEHGVPTAAASKAEQQTAADHLNDSAAAAPATTWRVYLGRMPLVGFEAVADALGGSPAHDLLQLHTYVLLEGPGQVWCFDFLPQHPTSPATAAALLTAQAIPGELRERELAITAVRTSSKICYMGNCKHHDPLATARSYNRSHNTQLHLLHNNCQHYTDGLIAVLLKDL
eukprot:GHUV01009990.1.p1 GENE.GHUV01009990.1~~GHUV01009990.1.p1  ORF type:complete len:221 (+),score=60.41 GHUV01009990.1:76-738(+)